MSGRYQNVSNCVWGEKIERYPEKIIVLERFTFYPLVKSDVVNDLAAADLAPKPQIKIRAWRRGGELFTRVRRA